MERGRICTLFALSTSALLFVSACATTGGSVGAGAAAGGLVGAGVGAIADPGRHGVDRFRNVVIGTAIGGVVGAGVGFMMDRHVKDERQESYEKGKKEAEKDAESHAAESLGNLPRLIPAKTEARWVPDQIRGTTFVPGHFEYMIVEGARWSAGSR